MEPVVFLALLMVVAILAGGVASAADFGIGSLLTPLLGMQTGINLAVVAVPASESRVDGQQSSRLS